MSRTFDVPFKQSDVRGIGSRTKNSTVIKRMPVNFAFRTKPMYTSFLEIVILTESSETLNLD